jgi:hypothetical protein
LAFGLSFVGCAGCPEGEEEKNDAESEAPGDAALRNR